MANQTYATGSEGPFIYDDEKEYPSSNLAASHFPTQVAFFGQGTIGQVVRGTTYGNSISYARELFQEVNFTDGQDRLFNPRIQNTNMTIVRIIESFNPAFCQAVLWTSYGFSAASDAAEILLDPKGVFGIGAGTNDFNFTVDGNNEVGLENNSGSDTSIYIQEESYNDGPFSQI